MVVSHLPQNIFQIDLRLTGRTPKLLHLRQQSPIFITTRVNLTGAFPLESWKFDPVINSHASRL